MAAILPEIFLGLFAGALVDRWNRRIVMIAADSPIALATVFLALLFWSGLIQPWHVFVILFLRSLGGVFHYNAMQASTSSEGFTPAVLVRDVRAGLRYVLALPGLVAILVMAMLINFLYSPAAMLMPLIITNHFNGTAWHLGVIQSFFGVGVVAGALLLSAWGGFRTSL